MLWSPTSSTLSFDSYIVTDKSLATYSFPLLNNKVLVYDDSPIPLVKTHLPYVMTTVLPQSLDLNQDRRVHERYTKFYYYKVLDDWLYDDMNDLLMYLKYDKNTKAVSKAGNDRSGERDSQEAVDAKIKFIEDTMFKKSDMYYILTKLVEESKINWYDLPKVESAVRDVSRNWLKKQLKK